jgi:hypothetical protein
MIENLYFTFFLESNASTIAKLEEIAHGHTYARETGHEG